MKKKAVIIGAGVGGLASGALLGKMGYDVIILEKNKSAGGRATRFSEKGFIFDMGPSWYLMPDVFEQYFKLFKKKPGDFFKLKKLDPQYRIFFSRRDIADIRSSIKDNYKLFESIEKNSSHAIREYLTIARNQYRIAMDDFVYKNYRNVRDVLSPSILRQGPKMHVFESLESYVSRYTKNEKLKKILMYSILFNGGSPKNTPALYAIMSHPDFHMGVFYPKGGIYQIIKALEKLCLENGVKIKTGQEATRILVSKNKARAVETKTKTYAADVVISNADYPFTETQLLEPAYRTYPETYWKKKTIAPSSFIMYLGIKGKVKKLKHHNLIFANNWDKHFEQVFQKSQLPDEPLYYVCCPSKSDPGVAPRGDENLFLLVPIPAGIEDTTTRRKKYASKIIKHLEGLIGETFSRRIKVQRIFSVNDYETMYNSYKGTALGLSQTLYQTAIFRPGNRSKKVRNLYFAGQYTTPGIGIPICLISSQLAAERIQNEQT